MRDEREIVLDILMEHERKGTYLNVLIRNAQDRCAELPLSQRSFIKRLAEGTLEREIELDAKIRPFLRDPSMKIKPLIRCILRMSVYQIYYMDSVPDFAAVDEAVRLLKKCGQKQAVGFVNAVLRNVCRAKAAAGEKIAGEGTGPAVVVKKSLSTLYSMPQEIIDLWEEAYGREKTEALLAALMEIRPVSIRMDARVPRQRAEAILRGMEEAGVRLKDGHYLPYCHYLSRVPGIPTLPGYAEGAWSVQDESSMLAVEAMELKGDETVLDLCAAPGGKTLHMASLLPRGEVFAYDLSRAKTDRIRDNAARMKLTNVTIAERDAEEPDPSLFEKGDVILCDLPCSGLGVITKKRDIKYNVTPEKIRSLTALQKRILKNAVRYVKPGGTLLYSTCTIDREENEKMADFIEKRLGLAPAPLAQALPQGIPGIEGNRLQLLPSVHHTDGFFLAKFRKPV